MAYVYQHIRLDKNEVFYVGVGTKVDNYFRANQKSKTSRSRFWHNIVSKTEYKVEIILDNVTNDEAFKKEIELIKFYGKRDSGGTLVNICDGGVGGPIRFGEQNAMSNPEHRKSVSNALKGIVRSEEYKKKMSETKKRLNQKPPSRLGKRVTKKIYQYNIEKEFIKEWEKAEDISTQYKCSKFVIQYTCRNNGTRYGYIWSYIKF